MREFGFTLIELMVGIGLAAIVLLSSVTMMRNAALLSRNTSQNGDFDNLISSLVLKLSTPAKCASAFATVQIPSQTLQDVVNNTAVAPISLDPHAILGLQGTTYGSINISSMTLALTGNLTATTSSNVYSANWTITGDKNAGAIINSLGGEYLTKTIPMQLQMSGNTIQGCSTTAIMNTLNEQLCAQMKTTAGAATWSSANNTCTVITPTCNQPNQLVGVDPSGNLVCLSMNCTPGLYPGGLLPYSQQVFQGIANANLYYNTNNGTVGPISPAPKQAALTPICFVAPRPSTCATPGTCTANNSSAPCGGFPTEGTDSTCHQPCVAVTPACCTFNGACTPPTGITCGTGTGVDNCGHSCPFTLSCCPGSQSFTTQGNYSFTIPCTTAHVAVYGAGGGGGSSQFGSNYAGAGGGGGYAAAALSVSPSTPITFTVGAGGLAGAANNQPGGQGGTSSFGPLSATGGGGGGGGDTSTGGAAGVGSGGTANLSGTAGGAGAATANSAQRGGNAGGPGGGIGGGNVTEGGPQPTGYGAGGGEAGPQATSTAPAEVPSAGTDGAVIISWP